MSKEDIINKLQEDADFKAIMSKTRTDEERRFVKAFTYEYITSALDAIEIVKNLIQSNPEEFKKQWEEYAAGVVMDSGQQKNGGK